MKKFLIVFSCFFTPFLQAEEKPTVDQLVQRFQDAAIAAEKGNKDNSSERTAQLSPYLNSLSSQIRSLTSRNDANSLEQVVQQINAMVPNPEVQKAADALLTRVQDDLVAQEKAYVESVNASVDLAVKTAFSAKKPQELDGLILDLGSRRQPSFGGNSEATQRAAEMSRSVVTFLCRWQDYLMQMNSGNHRAAAGVLTQLSQNTSAYPFVPRSEILARLDMDGDDKAESQEAKVVDLKTVTLENLDDVSKQVEELDQRNSTSGSRDALNALKSLQRARAFMQIGLIGETYNACIDNYSLLGNEDLISVRQQLLGMILPAYLDLGRDYFIKPSEKPADYLLRVAGDASQRQDWKALWKILSASSQIVYRSSTPTWLSQDISGLAQFLSAQNYEKAGQFEDAIRAYKGVLSGQGKYLPVDQATERLLALKKDHPDEFAAANKPREIPVRAIPYPPNPNYPR